jgi:Dolichyl-phosphate-mannose-protein mannosyltransferase/LmeA-like phospholipid-binding
MTEAGTSVSRATGSGSTLRPWLLLGALVLGLSVVTAIWVSIDRRPPEWDHANHLERAVDCYRILSEPGRGRLREILEATAFYPPVTTCAAGLLYFLFPVAPLTAQVVMLGFLALGVVSVFLLGRRLLDTGAGLLAAFLLSTAPFVVFSLTNFQLDLPLTGMVAFSLYLLLRTEGFSRTGWSLAFGIAAGIGMLTKPPFVVYLLPPLLWVVWQGRSARLGRLAAALVAATALALPWYGPRLIGLPLQVMNRSFKNAALEQKAGTFSPEGLLHYPTMFPTQFGLLAVGLFLWGLWALRRECAARAFLWIAALGPFVVFTLIQNKNLRYTLPILPAAALVAAAGARGLPPVLRRGVTWGCVVLGALQVSMTAFALPAPPTLPGSGLPMVFVRRPEPADWQHARILGDIERESGNQPVTVAIVPNYDFFSVSNFRYEAARLGLPFRMIGAWQGPPFGVDFVIVKTGSQGAPWTAERLEKITRAVDGDDPYLAEVFPVVGRYALPEGSVGSLRRRRIPALADGLSTRVAARLAEAPASLLRAYVRDPKGLRVALDYRPDALLRGEVGHVRLMAESATVGELDRHDRSPLTIRNIRIAVEGLVFNPRRLVETGELEVLDVSTLRLEHAVVTQADLDQLLRGQPAGTGVEVGLGDGAADVRVTRLGPAIAARVQLASSSTDRPLALAVDRVRVSGFPVPDLLAGWIVKQFDPTLALRRLPAVVTVPAVRIQPGRIEIGQRQ